MLKLMFYKIFQNRFIKLYEASLKRYTSLLESTAEIDAELFDILNKIELMDAQEINRVYTEDVRSYIVNFSVLSRQIQDVEENLWEIYGKLRIENISRTPSEIKSQFVKNTGELGNDFISAAELRKFKSDSVDNTDIAEKIFGILWLRFKQPHFEGPQFLRRQDGGKKAERLEKVESDWEVLSTSRFKKSIGKLDENSFSKLLGAVSDILLDPVSVVGNTKKPLVNNKKGLWRYRIGDYRLLYEPVPEAKVVTFLDFVHRGQAYH